MAKNRIRANQGDTSIWWIRRDLRLHHNLALQACVERGGAVLPVFVFDPAVLESSYHRDAAARQAFLCAGLRSLDSALRARGSRLVVRRGEPARVLANLVAQTGAGFIAAEEDYSPYASRRDAAVRVALPLHLAGGVTVHHPRDLLKCDGTPYSVFTPFSRCWHTLPLPAAEPKTVPASIRTPAGPESDPIPTGREPDGFPAGEDEARRRFFSFMEGPVQAYATARDRLDLAGTSALSPYFRFGMLSVRRPRAWRARWSERRPRLLPVRPSG